MLNRLVLILCLVLIAGLRGTQAANYQFQAEDDYFNSNITDPTTLLATSYAQSKALILGSANHRNFQHHLILIDLLQKVGTDPNLKYLILEQSYDNDELYKQLSTDDVFRVLRTHTFVSDHERLLTLCWSPEWTWVYTHVFPIVQDINRRRPANNPLLVRAVDGFSLKSPYGLRSSMPVKSEDCAFSAPTDQNRTDNIQNREAGTAETFYTQIWSKLQKNEKIIVLYHQAHLYRHFESCRVSRTGSGAESWISPRNWFSILLRDHPEVEDQSRLIIFDETDLEHHPQGVLRFTRRQAARRPGEAWAIDVRGMRGIDTERGQNAWIFSPISFDNQGMNYSDKYFYEIVDGVIWSPRAGLDYALGDVTNYMGNTCPKSRYDGHSAIPFGGPQP